MSTGEEDADKDLGGGRMMRAEGEKGETGLKYNIILKLLG